MFVGSRQRKDPAKKGLARPGRHKPLMIRNCRVAAGARTQLHAGPSSLWRKLAPVRLPQLFVHVVQRGARQVHAVDYAAKVRAQSCRRLAVLASGLRGLLEVQLLDGHRVGPVAGHGRVLSQTTTVEKQFWNEMGTLNRNDGRNAFVLIATYGASRHQRHGWSTWLVASCECW